jgi:hypothetical protein
MRAKRFVPGVVLVVAGFVVLFAGGGAVATDAVAIVLLGVGAVLVVATAFYEIGAGEDRDRRSGRA